MIERLTLATSTGLPFAALTLHAAAGTVALAAGWVAMAAAKGRTWHRRSGQVYVCAMIAMGLMAVGISVYEGKEAIAGGALAAYFVFTGWTAIRPLSQAGRQVDIALMLLAWVFAASGFAQAFMALGRPGNQSDGVPAGMQFFIATIVLLAGIGDVRMVRARNLQGTRRLARHLWRMCFGLFIATGSFLAQLVQMTFMPVWMRSLPVILILAAGPLVMLLYWMWRVRLKQNLQGVMTAKPIERRA